MKGRGKKLEFEKKYCGRQTASIKFSGDNLVKLAFKVNSNTSTASTTTLKLITTTAQVKSKLFFAC